MLRRCVMSQVRRLTTASSREHQTNFKSYMNLTPTQPLTNYRSHMIPTPFNQQQLFVFRSLSTASPTNNEKDVNGKDSEANCKGSEPPASSDSSSSSVETDSESSFVEWMKSIFEPPLFEVLGILVTVRLAFMVGKWLKNKYDEKKHVKRDESIDGRLKYEILGFKAAYDKSITAEIRNSRYLLVSGRIYNSFGWSVAIERQITLPNKDYSEANKRATFYRDVGSVVVKISDFKKVQDINIEVDKTK